MKPSPPCDKVNFQFLPLPTYCALSFVILSFWSSQFDLEHRLNHCVSLLHACSPVGVIFLAIYLVYLHSPRAQRCFPYLAEVSPVDLPFVLICWMFVAAESMKWGLSGLLSMTWLYFYLYLTVSSKCSPFPPPPSPLYSLPRKLKVMLVMFGLPFFNITERDMR